jgi:glucuronate isomerase
MVHNMNIYRISQDRNASYDTYDSAVVIAESEEAARRILPGYFPDGVTHITSEESFSWVSDAQYVRVELIGTAAPEYKEEVVVVASFNAG